MSILPHAAKQLLDRLRRGAINALLPSSCLLCGGDSATTILCPACAGDLPPLSPSLCPQCAEPTTHGERCGRCLATPPHFDTTVACYRYDFPLDRLVHALKYGHRLPIANWFAGQLADRIDTREWDLIIPLPLHAQRLKSRGFNQSAEIARVLGDLLGRSVDFGTLNRRRDTGPQAALQLKERAANVRGAFECDTDLAGRRILLVDDVMTSGATLSEAARTLKLHGAQSVHAAVVARALRN